jgi:hypothetical protein
MNKELIRALSYLVKHPNQKRAVLGKIRHEFRHFIERCDIENDTKEIILEAFKEEITTD